MVSELFLFSVFSVAICNRNFSAFVCLLLCFVVSVSERVLLTVMCFVSAMQLLLMCLLMLVAVL